MRTFLTWLHTALTLTLLCSTSHASVLDPVGIYGSLEAAQQCLQTTWIQAVQSIFDDPASCLRLAFHDSGTYNKNTKKGGANGSVVMELNITQFPVNAGLSVCGALVPVVVKAVHSAGCPNATVADVIQVMGAASVATAGGPFCSMLMGRPDSNAPDTEQDNLPVQCNNVTRLLQVFSNYGFTDPETALVTLSGAHTIGRARFTGTNCSRGNNFMTSTPSTFDNHYFREVVVPTGRLGWFFSDRTLMDPTISPDAVRDLMITYANSNEAFMTAWCRQYRELSLLGVDPTPAGFGINDGWVPAPWFQAPPPPDAPVLMPPSYPPPPASPGTVLPGTPRPGTPPPPAQRPPSPVVGTPSPWTPPPVQRPPPPVPKQQSPLKRRPPPRNSPRKSPERSPPAKSGCPRHQSGGGGGHSRTHHSG